MFSATTTRGAERTKLVTAIFTPSVIVTAARCGSHREPTPWRSIGHQYREQVLTNSDYVRVVFVGVGARWKPKSCIPSSTARAHGLNEQGVVLKCHPR